MKINFADIVTCTLIVSDLLHCNHTVSISGTFVQQDISGHRQCLRVVLLHHVEFFIQNSEMLTK